MGNDFPCRTSHDDHHRQPRRGDEPAPVSARAWGFGWVGVTGGDGGVDLSLCDFDGRAFSKGNNPRVRGPLRPFPPENRSLRTTPVLAPIWSATAERRALCCARQRRQRRKPMIEAYPARRGRGRPDQQMARRRNVFNVLGDRNSTGGAGMRCWGMICVIETVVLAVVALPHRTAHADEACPDILVLGSRESGEDATDGDGVGPTVAKFNEHFKAAVEAAGKTVQLWGNGKADTPGDRRAVPGRAGGGHRPAGHAHQVVEQAELFVIAGAVPCTGCVGRAGQGYRQPDDGADDCHPLGHAHIRCGYPARSAPMCYRSWGTRAQRHAWRRYRSHTPATSRHHTSAARTSSSPEVLDYHDVNTGVLAASLAKRAPGYTSLGFPDPRRSTTHHRPH